MKKIAAILITFIFAESAFAADIDLGEGYHVQDGFSSILITTSDGTAIQNAVDHIKDGGTVELSGDFTLKKTITINKNLTLKGVNNAVLKGNETFRAIRCQGIDNNITLENLTITGGSGSKGGAVKIDEGSVKIMSCDFYNNLGWLGGGAIHSIADTLILENCNVHDNKAGLMGGGIFTGSRTVTLTNCNITSNSAAMSGGGLAAASDSNITMENCKITGNRSTFAGTGVSIVGTKLKAISCDISNNLIMSLDKGIASPDANIKYDNSSTYEEVKEEEK